MSLPMSAQELCESVRLCRPIQGSRLNRMLGVNPGRALVEVQASVTWRMLAAHLRPGDDRAGELRTTRATIGESVAWNAAGPDGRPAVTHVESLTMVTPDGQLRRINRIASPALFALTVGGQSLFGTLYSVTLRLESLSRTVSDAVAPETLLDQHAGAAARNMHLLVPPEQVEAFVRETRERCAEWRIPITSVQSRPIREEEETFLRWAARDYAEVNIGLGKPATLGSAVRATQLSQELIDAAISRGGTFPIACTPEATRAQTQACYPQLASFFAEQRRIDPSGRMANAWSRHQRSLLGREACEVRWSV